MDMKARDEEILGKPVRIAPLKPEEWTEEIHEITQGLRKAAGAPPIHHVPDYLATVLRHPAPFRPILEVGRVMLGHATVPLLEREMLILRNAWLLGASYEWGEHVKIGRRVGMTEAQQEAIIVGSSDPLWNEKERALLRLCEELIDHYSVSDETWAVLAKNYNQQQLLELLVVVGQYTATALIQNALRSRPDPGNNGMATRWKDCPPPAKK